MTVKTRKKRERDQRDELLDRIDFKGLAQEEVLGQGGILKQLTGRLLQKVLEAEMAEHLGYGKHDSAGDNSGGSRNGRPSGSSARAGGPSIRRKSAGQSARQTR
jgi:hypothetical protein